MKSKHGAALLELEQSCECPCHNPVLCRLDAVRHQVACCCEHRMVIGCKECPA